MKGVRVDVSVNGDNAVWTLRDGRQRCTYSLPYNRDDDAGRGARRFVARFLAALGVPRAEARRLAAGVEVVLPAGRKRRRQRRMF